MRSIIFDLDGTLVDSAPDLHAAVNLMLQEEALAPLDLGRVRSFIGNGVAVLVQRAMAAHGEVVEGTRLADLEARFMAHYSRASSDLTRLFDGAGEAVKTLSEQGYRLAICTNKPVAPTHQILEMGWLPPSPDGIAMCQGRGVQSHASGEDGDMKDTMIGVDLAKRVFQLHGATMAGEVKFRKKLSRDQFRAFMAAQPAALIVFEACGGASYWAREVEALGHEVRLIAPQYVRPFVKRQKNDAADAEAIVIAARQPEMRFVAPKTAEQQAKAVVFRGRERLVHQRTELVNALRAVLYEYGHVFPVGFCHVKRIAAKVEDPGCDLPALVISECKDLLEQIAEKTERIEAKTKTLKVLAAETDTARRLQTMPGVGPLTALAFEAFAPDMAQFKSGRDFAAWLGLVPKQHSSGGKERLGRMTKAGQTDIRRLLIIGAMSRMNWLGQRTILKGSWLSRMLARKPKMLVAIALANKMARQIWAMLTKNEDYKDPALATA